MLLRYIHHYSLKEGIVEKVNKNRIFAKWVPTSENLRLIYVNNYRMTKERIEYIDIAKFFGIFLMVLCHAGMHNIVTSVIYAFHMPLFFFLSGYLYDRKKQRNLGQYFVKKCKTIMIPYIIFALILCFGTRYLVDWVLIIYGSRDSLFAASSFTPLWFLPCFFLSTIFYSFVSLYTKKSEKLYFGVIILIGILGFYLSSFRHYLCYGCPWNADVALIGVVLMALGNEAKRLLVDKYRIIGGGIFLLIGIVLSLLNLPESLTEGNPHVEMSVSVYGNPLLFLLTAFLLCYATIIISREIVKRCDHKIVKLITYYGSNTITVLCIHGIALQLFQLGLKRFQFEGAYYALIISLLVFTVLYPIIIFINKYLPNIVGKTPERLE